MRPNPTIPMVLPRSSVPSNRFRSHSPRRIASAAHGMWRACASRRPMACSAALTVFAPGAFITAMPRRVAACTSMLSTPVPALIERGDGVVAHVPDADGGLLQGTVPRADGPARLFQRADDLLRALPFGHFETRHGPASASLPRQIRDAVLLAPFLHAAAHRIVPTPAPLSSALALDPGELRLKRIQQGDRGRVGRLMLGRGMERAAR